MDPPAAASRNVDVIAKRAIDVRIGGNHWLIVEVICAVFEIKEGNVGISLSAVS